MPTHDELVRFLREYNALTPGQQRAFLGAVAAMVEDLPSRRFRRSLRIKSVSGFAGVFEMTWAPDGRATFHCGTPVRDGSVHVVWRRIGGHEIFYDP